MPLDMPRTRATSAFLPDGTPTLADLLAAVTTDGKLPERRRREIASSLRTLSRLLGRPLDRLPAHPAWLRERLARVSAAQGGLSKGRFSNVKSDLRFALRQAGMVKVRRPRLAPLSGLWKALWRSLPQGRMRWTLSRLCHHCSAAGIAPEAVDDAVAEQFHTALVEEGLLRDPDQVLRQTIRVWNLAAETIAGWPRTRLTPPPPKRRPWTIPLELFPHSFREELAAWEARLTGADLLAEDAPIRPLSPATVKHRLFQVRMFASALVHQGHPVEAIMNLAYLVEVEHFKEGLRFLLERASGRPTEAIHGLAMGIKAIARHQVKVSEAQLETLRRICKRLDLEVEGIRERNRARLLQFDDERNLAALLFLPSQLLRLARRLEKTNPRKAVLLVQLAAAIEILLHAPLRISELAGLDMDEHLRWTQDRHGGALHIVIPQHDVKNRKSIHHELRGETAALIKLYIELYRSRLCDRPSPWLFPGRSGRHKHPGGFSQQIKKVIWQQAGLNVNSHLFRHLAGKVHLRLHPGDFVTVSRVLHDELSTVERSYTQFEKRNSLLHYQDTICGLREQLVLGRKVRKPRRKPEAIQ